VETAVLGGSAAAPAPACEPRLISSSSVDEGRFLPGTVLAGRYRIAGLLGRGGMGEVYRATDLVLGQAVALKFLPDTMARDDRALARFYNEVRIARQVTHPNVCRVYDIGEVEGQHYISMEFVDGEDLASLLRRIGRLPADKALEIARKLCMGLAAAHEKGVLHRDLKPANVMIDGRGQVIIMDFGLAGLTEQLQGDVRSGTPAYMSPEQLAGTEVTARSDIYALGLVLYELFTGRRAFEASSLMELMQMQERAAPLSITSVAKDLDPASERAILRCIQPDPRQRPASAMAVAAALPGGDPLAAALAAGETPSPDLVAAAGETEGLRPRVAVAWLAATLAGIVLIGVAGARFGAVGKLQMELPPEALAEDAHKLLASMGYQNRPVDRTLGLGYDDAYLDYLRHHPDLSAARWRDQSAGFPPIVTFAYRESPQEMTGVRNYNTTPNYADPPMEISGMVRLRMDPQGKLRELEAVPAQVEPPVPALPAPDWTALFRAAGFDPTNWQPVDAEWTPLANWDARAAWISKDAPGGIRLRIEAAAWRGRPVSFRIIGPWTKPERMEAPSTGPFVMLLVVYFGIAAGAVIAWWSIRAKRADFRGAAKLGLIYFGCFLTSRFVAAHHSLTAAELSVFWKSVGVSAINASVVWVMYVALEPWVRRWWPQTLISWSRFTTKGFRDPLVGRDLLYGAAFGCVAALFIVVGLILGGPTIEPLLPTLTPLLGPRRAIASGLEALTQSLFEPVWWFFLLFILRVTLRRVWIASAAFVGLFVLIDGAGSALPWIELPLHALTALLVVMILLRFGLLALMAAKAFSQFLLDCPRTLDSSLWYFGVGIAPLVVVALVAYYGFRVALAGRPLFDPFKAGDPR
jgi:predicted Ser/Thr protein kinase